MAMKIEKHSGIAGWVKWAIEDKVLVYILVAALVVCGGVGLFRMNKDEFPTFELTQGLVAGVYPGAGAEEVEQQLTKPLEETLFSFKEVNRKLTRSVTKDGICYIYVDLNCSQSKKDQVWSKIKLGLQTRKLTLPAGVLAVTVLDDFSAVSALLISMESPDKSYTELQDYADELCERLREIPELASVNVVGAQEEEIAVTLDREKLSSYGIDPTMLLLNYESSTLNVPAGTFSTEYADAPLRVGGTVSGEREVAEKIVYTDPSGNVLRLKDVAQVERRMKHPGQYVSYNGRSCLIINVEMRPDNNIVAFGKEVDRVLGEYSSTLPDSVTLSKVSDQPRVVATSVFSFVRDLLISMLVVILVMVMMFPIRSALIASSGVPVCTAIALAIMFFVGMDVNTVTLAALIVVLGMIVDDSIITMDGYMDKISRGYGRLDAACASAKELFLPTFIATSAICAMFFPMKGIITGYLGDFVKMFPWVITIALMTSLLYAVTVVPSLEVRFISPAGPAEKKGLIARAQEHFFDFIQRIYEKAQSVAFRFPKTTVFCGLAAVALGLFMFSRTNVQMMPMAARDYFVVEMEVENGRDIGVTRQYVDSLTGIMLSDRRINSVTSFVGTGAPRFCATYAPKLPSPSFSQMLVRTESTKATEAILKEYGKKYEHIFPGVLIRFKQMDYQAVESQVAIDLKGRSREDLLDAADKLKAYMYTLNDELTWVHSNCDNFIGNVRVDLDPDEASRLGVNRALLALSLSGTYDGQTLATIWEGDRAVPVNVYSTGNDPDSPYESIGDRMVATTVPGVSVPLRQVASLEPDWKLSELDRSEGIPSVTVSADMRSGKSQPAAMKKIRHFIRTELEPELPEGITIEYGGLSSMNEDVAPEILLTFLAAVTVLFVFLLFHFKKVSLAFLTLILSSLCLFGAFFGLWIFQLDFTMTAVLGLISLVGIIVRNGILMFEYAEDQRFRCGVDVKTASMEAGKRRMRPIFLTSCTTALGVLPMIISGDNLWMPMGVVICFGTLLSIFLIVLIMPVSYWLIFRNAGTVPAVETTEEKNDEK